MRSSAFVSIIGLAVATLSSHAQVVAPEFADNYTSFDLGSVPGVPTNYGGLMFSPDDPNVLLISGSANQVAAKVYAIPVNRDADGSVIGFGCEVVAVPVYDTPRIDGGLDVGPDGVIFYTTYSDNTIGQIMPGSTGPDRVISLGPLGVASSTGTLRFVPSGFAGAGRLKIVSYNASRWYDAEVSPDGDGTFDIAVSRGFVQLSGGPEGVVYIAAGNPQFAADSVLVSKYLANRVDAYEIDDNGDPIPSTQRVFVSGLTNAEGAAIDPLTGDFFFSTFGGGNRVIRVSGFLGGVCVGDLNGDGVVDGADLGILLSNWGTTSGGAAVGDLNGNCVVDGADLGILLANWGVCR